MQTFFYITIYLLHISLSLYVTEHFIIKEGNSEIYKTVLTINQEEWILIHAFPLILQKQKPFSRRTISAINNSSPLGFGKPDDALQVKDLVRNSLLPKSKDVDYILQSISVKNEDNIGKLIFNKRPLKPILKEQKTGSIDIPTEKRHFADIRLNNKITSFLPKQITDDYLIAQYENPSRSQFQNFTKLKLSNQYKKEYNLTLPKNVLIKQFFLDHIKDNALSLLTVGSINNYLLDDSTTDENKTKYDNNVKKYTIDFFDCSDFAHSKENVTVSKILTITFTFLDVIMSKNADTISLESVKDGTCILYDSTTNKNIQISYKNFLFNQDFSRNIDLSNFRLQGGATLTIEKYNKPEKKPSLTNNQNLPKKNVQTSIKKILFDYQFYFLGSATFLICIYLIQYYAYKKGT